MTNGNQVFVKLARGVLFLLVFIHWVLPFTPVNQHPEITIKIGSLVLGAAFLFLAIRSIASPRLYFLLGLALLVAVYIVSATTGASPLREGLVVKVVFAAALVIGVISSSKK